MGKVKWGGKKVFLTLRVQKLTKNVKMDHEPKCRQNYKTRGSKYCDLCLLRYDIKITNEKKKK